VEDLGIKTGDPLPDLFQGKYLGKKVLITGHTGFKGSWLSIWLRLLGADVMGYALEPASCLDNYVLCGLQNKIRGIYGDVRDVSSLNQAFDAFQPDMVFHLAAQPNVRLSYAQPHETFETNVMGTVNVMEAFRKSKSASVCIIVTSDKCYENKEQIWGYRENDRMGGFDPYSASKGCAELVTSAYNHSFFQNPQGKAVASVRAGNVFGGGDWTKDRIIPDCMKALLNGTDIEIRNPSSVRPWQFVLEPLYGYLLLGAKILKNPSQFSGAWNFGPDFSSVIPVNHLVNMVVDIWNKGAARTQINYPENLSSPHEAALLSLDCTKAKMLLDWSPRLSLHDTLAYTVHWYQNYASSDVHAICIQQINDYCKLPPVIGPERS